MTMHPRHLFFSLLLLVLTGTAHAQTNPINTNCQSADRLCMGTLSQSFNFTNNFIVCLSNTTRLYYTFRTSADVGFSLGTLTTSTASHYKIYGPFESHMQGCAQLNSVAPASVAASSSASTSHTLTFSYVNNMQYILEVIVPSCSGSVSITATRLANCQEDISCTDCIKGFQPGPGKYVVSAWVKETSAEVTATNYANAQLIASCPSVAGSATTFTPSGQIIDGWQQIDGIYTIPAPATDFRLELKSLSGVVLFDDVRIFPADGSMVSYVYDPVTLRLAAELDERNYAKLYEYDEEGKLVRVKKETEKGIMTIQENRENSTKN